MLRRYTVLLIAIRPPDGDVKPGGPICAYREEKAMSRHRVSPSPFLSSSSHTPQYNYNTRTLTHTVTLSSTSTVRYTDTRPTRNVVCPSGAWIEKKATQMPSISANDLEVVKCSALETNQPILQYIKIKQTLFDSYLWQAFQYWCHSKTTCNKSTRIH